MRATPFLTALAVLVLSALGAPARAGEEWKKEKPWRDLQAAEAKALTALLRSAVKEDYRRQAWYLADRLLAVDPGSAEATKVAEGWNENQLQEGMVPKKGWLDKRDKALRELGDQYARLAEVLTGAGVPAEDFYPLNIRARAYGTGYAAALQAFEEAGFVWLGTFGDLEKAKYEEALGEVPHAVTFPPEYDDDYLEVRVRWPEAKAATYGRWHLTTDEKAVDALRHVGTLAALESWWTDAVGSEGKAATEPTEVLLFADAKVYDRVAPAMVHETERADLKDSSTYHSPWRRTVFVLSRHRTNAWIGEEATLLGAAGPLVARHHQGGGNASRITGRGCWVLDGVAGACQGLVRGKGKEEPTLDPKRCWLLAAARALREENLLLPWEEFYDLDRAKADALPKRTVKVSFAGGSFEAKDVNVAHAQATAFVVGLLQADGGKGAARLGRLLHDLFLRDSLPDLGKTVGWKPSRLAEEAAKAIDAAAGP